MSADGSKLAAATTNGPIYLSTNFGATWQMSKAPLYNWSGIASSFDGAKLVAVGGSYLGVGPIYTSTNSGLDWISNATPSRAWRLVASSADGANLVATAQVYIPSGQFFPGPLFTSTNSGLTWHSNNVPQAYWTFLASSADGSKLAAAGDTGLYVSTNFGRTWARRRSWVKIACSADASVMVAVASDHYVYLSTDLGASWRQSSALSGFTIDVICSPDGKWIGVGASDGFFVSADSGATWSETPSAATFDNWSADGRKWVGRNWLYDSTGAHNAGISIYQSTQRSEIGISLAHDTLRLSWPVPSTSVSLQRSLDIDTAVWETVTNTPFLNLNKLQNEVVLPTAGDRGFYRLSEPTHKNGNVMR